MFVVFSIHCISKTYIPEIDGFNQNFGQGWFDRPILCKGCRFQKNSLIDLT